MLRLNFSFSYGPGLVYQVLELFWIASVINSNIFFVSLPSIFIFFMPFVSFNVFSPADPNIFKIKFSLCAWSSCMNPPVFSSFLCLCFQLSPFLLILRVNISCTLFLVLFPLACLLWLISPVFHSTHVCLHFPDCPSHYSGSYCILSSVPLTLPLNYCQHSHNKLFSLDPCLRNGFDGDENVKWKEKASSVIFWDSLAWFCDCQEKLPMLLILLASVSFWTHH